MCPYSGLQNHRALESTIASEAESSDQIATFDAITSFHVPECNMLRLNNCPACGRVIAKLKRVGHHRVVRNEHILSIDFCECPCGHVFTNPQQEWNDLSPFYGDYHVFHNTIPDDSALDKAAAQHTDRDRYNHAKIVSGGRYLDVGCGLGTMVRMMQRFGMDAEGVEPAAVAATVAQEKGVKVKHGTLEDARYPDRVFDSITMYDVIEHLPDPVATLKECRRILKPGGEVFIGTPNYDSLLYCYVGSTWRGLDLPHHIHLFRMSSMQMAAERANLKVVHLTTQSILAHVESQIVSTLRRRAFIPARLNARLGLVRPFARYLTNVGNASGRGEAIVAYLQGA
jgi:2-polyprenyl-3-methyl-5-hydroxy-6-metoxy-1,4-benzoquinol methylase